MDDSWRMRMGMPNLLPHRKSTGGEHTFHHYSNKTFSSAAVPEPIDFNDVFGGPPRSALARNFSGDFTRTATRASFGDDVFRSPDLTPRSSRNGRNLPAFRSEKLEGSRGSESSKTSDGFYSDIFGSDDDVRFQSKSKSSSELSSEDLSPVLPVTGEDAGLSRFASNLRPINVPCTWNSSMVKPTEPPKRQPLFPSTPTSYLKNHFIQNDNEIFSNPFNRFSRQVPSPESTTPRFFGNMTLSKNEVELGSSTSCSSSVFRNSRIEATNEKIQNSVLQERKMEKDNYDDYDDEDDDDDEMMSSYVIEINSDYRERYSEAISIDEAVAWAKEKYLAPSSVNLVQSSEIKVGPDLHDQGINGHGNALAIVVKVENPQSEEKDKEEMEMELLNEEIQLWSIGNEANIRLLLSTLHNILWPNSGWSAIPMSNLVEFGYVKKAYQKARLCIHPDKLQQRGATSQQKHVAEKAFTILQDAWAAFISQDVLSGNRVDIRNL